MFAWLACSRDTPAYLQPGHAANAGSSGESCVLGSGPRVARVGRLTNSGRGRHFEPVFADRDADGRCLTEPAAPATLVAASGSGGSSSRDNLTRTTVPQSPAAPARLQAAWRAGLRRGRLHASSIWAASISTASTPIWLLFADGFATGRIANAARSGSATSLVGLALLVLTLPLMALTALLIRLDSPGPVLYRQQRVGLHGKPFTLFKFRSMTRRCRGRRQPRWATQQDPRITRDRPLHPRHPHRRIAATAQRPARRNEPGRATPGTPAVRRATGAGHSVLPGAQLRQAGHDRLGAGQFPLRRLGRGCPRKALLRPVLCEEPHACCWICSSCSRQSASSCSAKARARASRHGTADPAGAPCRDHRSAHDRLDLRSPHWLCCMRACAVADICGSSVLILTRGRGAATGVWLVPAPAAACAALRPRPCWPPGYGRLVGSRPIAGLAAVWRPTRLAAWPAGWRLLASAAWYGFILHLYRRSVGAHGRSCRPSSRWACWRADRRRHCRCSTCSPSQPSATPVVARHRHPARLRRLQHPAARKPLFQHAAGLALAHQPALRRAGGVFLYDLVLYADARPVPPAVVRAVRRPRQRHRARRAADRPGRRAQPALGHRYPCLARRGVPQRHPGRQRHVPARPRR